MTPPGDCLVFAPLSVVRAQVLNDAEVLPNNDAIGPHDAVSSITTVESEERLEWRYSRVPPCGRLLSAAL